MKREQVLNQAVADLSQFATVIHQTHWYMRGNGFLTMHPKMDELMDEVNEWLDEIAERLIIIGGSPYSTLKEFAEHTKISDEIGSYDKLMTDHVETVLSGYRYLQGLAEEGIEAADDEDDAVTEDIFIGIKAAVEKKIWMLSAQLGRAPEIK
ncbi:Dps family protein [Vagococcus xieshaowenii]|uniref:DNA starvation/stationary phase protection protein n=1 Tax=Vagococcus xieshaowenii TaxID=2562451 RepID=A0AAJ5EG06_9ENTE|nr:DNA starvation/stationary phase protection protein [Vagococcus xieshaowenii]QCA29007.1 DNA starvation/stationary phase protection protein [Vagococcus xieshaowenii]TFZ41018.1 DNA starvation/stationary phase protection protein [Vagococcus xieshaowenii]